MHTVVMKRIVIIGDETVEYRLLQEIQSMGATGYTCYAVCGKGARGIRPRHGEPGNTKIEVIATSELAHQILEYLGKHYFEDYAMIAFIDDVEVLQGEKFGAKSF
jgi:nitrogen regulatory protein P-II 2